MNKATRDFIDVIIGTSKMVREETHADGIDYNAVIEFAKDGTSLCTVFVPPFEDDDEKIQAMGISLYACQVIPQMPIDAIVMSADTFYAPRPVMDDDTGNWIRPRENPDASDAIVVMAATEDEVRGVIIPYVFGPDNTIEWSEQIEMSDEEAKHGAIPSLMRAVLLNKLTHPTSREDYERLIEHKGGAVRWSDEFDESPIGVLVDRLTEAWDKVLEEEAS